MSINFIATRRRPYIGTYFVQPATICMRPGPNGRPVLGDVVQLNIDWNNYGAPASSRVCCSANLQTQGAGNVPGDFVIKSVYIDNYGSNVPIYVYFPDTQFTVTAPAQSSGWYPVITGGLRADVIADGITTGNVPTTLIYFGNFAIQPYTDYAINQSKSLYLASRQITNGTNIYNEDLGVPALGDGVAEIDTTFNAFLPVIPFVIPAAAVYLYLTAYEINFYSVVATADGSMTAQLLPPSSAGICTWVLGVRLAVANYDNTTFIGSGFNWKFRATGGSTWRLNMGSSQFTGSGRIHAKFSYTTNPN